jgi:hypothetical protein
VNNGLAHGRYFFMDVAKDGIALYQADESELHTPKPKTPEQALAIAKEYFEEGFRRSRARKTREICGCRRPAKTRSV